MRLGHSLPPPRDLATQLRGLFRNCGIELLSLLIAITFAAALSVWLPVLREWDSAAVVTLISGIWVAVCVAIYQFLHRRTSR